jgi:uridine kinase
MKGDILIIKEHHRKAGTAVAELLMPQIQGSDNVYVITVAGESGAGKSEIAAATAENLEERGIKTYIFQQDDFFIFPPKTNANRRKEDINWVGTREVKLDLIDEILLAIKNGVTDVEKPLVIFDEDRITEEQLNLEDIKVIIVEGTYTTLLENVDCHVFIDRNINDTKESRKERAREEQDEFLEKILMIEHKIIAPNKVKAHIIIDKDYSVNKPE